MKRLVTLVLALLMLAVPVSAESIFGNLLPVTATPAPTAAPTPAPAVTQAPASGGLFIMETTAAAGIPEQLQSPAFVAMFGVPEQVSTTQGIALRYSGMDMKRFVGFVSMLDTSAILTIQYDVANGTLLLLCGAGGNRANVQVTADTVSDNPDVPAPMPKPAKDCPDCNLGVCSSCGNGQNHCGSCYGGDCSQCGGDGYKLNYKGDEVKCTSCNNGACKRCDGTGFIDCPKCDGGSCKRCGGDGEL
ncbi:MAG: hypothetical protein IJ343_04620 [Clostridia bacterium]|nr:hypothetical protein [Clostridia bacterium]